MKVIKIIFTVTAITMALTLFFTTRNSVVSPPPPENASQPFKQAAAAKRVSRFLQQKDKNPRAADHCNKDNEICSQFSDGKNTTTCCNNKCIDLKYDDDNCGACKNKCVFTKSCCRGQCVDLAFDKRHCGACNKRCMTGGFCIYGMCDYA